MTQPQQNRSAQSFSRVKAAALTLMSSHATMDFRLSDVSRLAQVSIGSIYARVESKADLVRLIQHEELERLVSDLRHVVERAAEREGFQDAVRTLVGGYVTETMRNAPLLRFFVWTSQSDDIIASEGQRAVRASGTLFIDALRTAAHRSGLEASDERLRWCYTLTDSMIAQRLSFSTVVLTGEDASLKLDELADQLTETIIAYLTH